MDADFARFIRSSLWQRIERRAAAAIRLLEKKRRATSLKVHTAKPTLEAQAFAGRVAMGCLSQCHDSRLAPGSNLIQLLDLVLSVHTPRSAPRNRDSRYLAAQYFAVHRKAWNGGHDRACARTCGASNHAVFHWRTQDRAFRKLVGEVRDAMSRQPAYAAAVKKRVGLTQPKQNQ